MKLPSPRTWLYRLPAHVINGITVAAGIGLVSQLFAVLFDAHAAQFAMTGALYASLADRPGTLARTWRTLLAAAALGLAATMVVDSLKHWPLVLGAGIVLVVFVANMALAWGPRAAPVSFAAVLAIVFTMGMPVAVAPLQLATWHLLGVLAYLAWALAIAALLQPRYRSLALAAALRASADLLRSRAEMLAMEAAAPDIHDGALRHLVRDEAELAELFQAARDLLFAAPDTPRNRRQTSMLLHAIDMRDILLASRLDLDLLGEDATAGEVRGRLARQLDHLADSLDEAARDVQEGGFARTPGRKPSSVSAAFTLPRLPPHDARARLLPAIVDRVDHLAVHVDRIHALLRGEEEDLPLPREELQRFVAPEGWPLGALKPHRSLDSPVLRHALRAALALGSAYCIALALPWASHPQWLVLSVAVVLRGNLQQTLERRNVRVLGTALGCVIVLLLLYVPSAALLHLVFLSAVGLAHGFSVKHYLVTAAAATVMALLQPHLLDPAAGFPIGERLADTVLGALLAWAFSFVLPSWERRALPRVITRSLHALRSYASLALAADAPDPVAQRLARRQAYDSLEAVATSLKRSAAEPERVRLPEHEVARMLDHAQRLMAHLSMVRLALARRGGVMDRAAAGAALAQADAALAEVLAPRGWAHSREDEPNPRTLERLPPEPPERDPLPWLLRRLEVTVHEGRVVARTAGAALAKLNASSPRPAA